MVKLLLFSIIFICSLSSSTNCQETNNNSTVVMLLWSGASIEGEILDPADNNKTSIMRVGDNLILHIKEKDIFRIITDGKVAEAKLALKEQRPKHWQPRLIGSSQYQFIFGEDDQHGLVSISTGLFVLPQTSIGFHTSLDAHNSGGLFLGISIRQYLVTGRTPLYLTISAAPMVEGTVTRQNSRESIRVANFEAGLGLNIRFWTDTFIDLGAGVASGNKTRVYIKAGFTQTVW